MKNYFSRLLLAAILCAPFTISAQVTIGSNRAPSPWSVLDLCTREQQRALHNARVDTEQRNALMSNNLDYWTEEEQLEAQGLLIFNTDPPGCLEFWSGSRWVSLCESRIPYMTVTPRAWVFAQPSGNAHTFTVSTNVRGNIEVTNLPDWANDITFNQTTRTFTITTTQQNPNHDPRDNHTITVTVGNNVISQPVIISQMGTDAGRTAIHHSAYVGAFWRNDQRGERLIRMNNPVADSEWHAIATEDWIQLDTHVTVDMMVDGEYRPTRIRTIGAGAGNMGFFGDETSVIAEDHRLPDGNNDIYVRIPNNPANPTAWTIEQRSGVARAGGQVSGTGNIVFRIGLDSYNDNDETNPINARNRTPEPVPGRLPGQESWGREPRWGQVIVVHSGGVHIIWIRQGEDTAELMRVGDEGNTNALRTATNVCPYTNESRIRSFSPFNLTAPGTIAHMGPQLPVRTATSGGGIFVEYPSQVGAMFQFAGNSVASQRRAWGPGWPELAPNGWVSTRLAGTWYSDAFTPSLATLHETCPPGFRRPQDGPPFTPAVANTTPQAVQASETRQSLWLNPVTGGTTVENSNAVRGFYADGFFDRRPKNGLPGSIGGTDISFYVGTRWDGRYAVGGTLFFNPFIGASLFFPGSPFRMEQGGANYGSALYLTATSLHNEHTVWFIQLGRINAPRMHSNSRAHGGLIRCVAE